ncbi:2OG-Fe(II) oxygenase family protein [Sphingosinicella sp. LHD-64]|uniref:2OG-Fe(II) oxygenase n=1 Tax=Sphingosinicella sp. LHD-64 TaxID=3072139 RepID=UPI00280E0DFA|nr:2OG-Fe(II) oxygenase family protein [Sphingosinicella sp. LHD-64]MDQ8756087.1 2OG-Fe(II) oxygenase family protein [Sphingosinicella sp. LHD-64]
MTFALHPAIDAEALRRTFAADRRIQIAPFLDDASAQALRDHLLARDDWRLVFNAGEKFYEVDRPGQASMTAEQQATLDGIVMQAATLGFQYRYETIRVPDDPAERGKNGSLLDQLALFLSSGPARDLLRTITGAHDIAFADAQATCYGPGHFLTLHDDNVAGKNRRLAYVLGLTPKWRAEWGGLLMFHDEAGDIERALLPRMNVLNLFAVPQAHSVNIVAPFAGAPRYSVTGWLRTG